MTISPNPSQGQFVLKIKTSRTALNIRIINILGHTVFEKKLESIQTANTSYLNLQHLPSGLYELILSDNKDLLSTRIVIRK
jgi:plasmid maintenance system killer protein